VIASQSRKTRRILTPRLNIEFPLDILLDSLDRQSHVT
jgi:hypothetical protein